MDYKLGLVYSILPETWWWIIVCMIGGSWLAMLFVDVEPRYLLEGLVLLDGSRGRIWMGVEVSDYWK